MLYRLLSIPVIVVVSASLALASQPAPLALSATQGAPLLIAAATPKAAPQAKKSTAKPAAKEIKVNMNELFPPGKGRELVLDNCMSCHSMAPTVVAQKTRFEWKQFGSSHREACAKLSDEQYNQLLEYLVATFNPTRPVPQLPEELLSGWTNY